MRTRTLLVTSDLPSGRRAGNRCTLPGASAPRASATTASIRAALRLGKFAAKLMRSRLLFIDRRTLFPKLVLSASASIRLSGKNG